MDEDEAEVEEVIRDKGRYPPMEYSVQIEITYYQLYVVMIFGVRPMYFDIMRSVFTWMYIMRLLLYL